MTKSTENFLEELKTFQSRLYAIDLDEPSSSDELKGILDDYIDNKHSEVFCEDYLIAGFDVALVRTTICKAVEMFHFKLPNFFFSFHFS